MKILHTAPAALAVGAMLAFANQAQAVTTDEFLGSAAVSPNNPSNEIDALASILGVDSDLLLFAGKGESPSSELQFIDGDPDQFVIDVAPDEPMFFALKFGIGGTGETDDVYFFRNLAELTLLVFENSQVNNLINLDDLGGETRLSHYTLVNQIPLPAGLPLMLGAFGVFGLFANRRRKALAALPA